MILRRVALPGFGWLLGFLWLGTAHAQENLILRLWPASAPGEVGTFPEESDSTKPTDGLVAGERVIRLANVQTPTLTIYQPASEKKTGAVVLVCPGGGYNILAMDLEGTETCQWLNSIGVTAALLKYRVPRREGRPPHEAPLQDAQRALNLLRSQAASLGIDPQRIGCLGYSAGGNLCGLISTRFAKITYGDVDSADALTPRPDFAMLIYPAYLVDAKDRTKLAESFQIPGDAPPMFLTMAQDDPLGCENVLVPAMELNRLKIPFSLHLFPAGGHGYGHRRTDKPSTQWTDQAEAWLRERGYLRRP
jgi:acetyl esterase/lipase